MCMPHQKPAKQPKKQIRGQKVKHKKIKIDREAFEHGDKTFIDERKPSQKQALEKKGFLSKLFS